jgi:hypothetical protein
MSIASISKGCLFITFLKQSRNKLIFSGSQRKQRRLWVTKVKKIGASGVIWLGDLA